MNKPCNDCFWNHQCGIQLTGQNTTTCKDKKTTKDMQDIGWLPKTKTDKQ